MTNPSEGVTLEGQAKKMGTAANPRELLAQVASLIEQRGSEGDVNQRLEQLQAKLESLSERIESGGTGSAGSVALPEKAIAEKLKKLLTGILFESGILEKIVSATVERKLEAFDVAGGAGGQSTEEMRKESVRLVKEFLSENLEGLFRKQIRAAVSQEMQNFMASEEMKTLIDDKFRTIQLYLTTEVIPNNVRQILQKGG